ncbi:hypothetical protein BX600DRAFT_518608 [Xylariales sp. PMI_506]|nr:hypothetical protein BX600DRAFT_518608 [Xylariales sp. PMI_506]
MDLNPQSVSRDAGHLRLLYGPIVFVKALNTLFRKCEDSFGEVDSLKESNITEEQSFQCFVNKLAQVCDSSRGGVTVTAVAILRSTDGPVYVLGSNRRDPQQLEQIKQSFVDLLNLIASKADNISEKALRKQVLWHILESVIDRVQLYLNNIIINLDKCIDECTTNEVEAQAVKKVLKQLQEKATFPRDTRSDDNAKSKFFSDCETLIKAMYAYKGTPFEEVLDKRAKEETLVGPRHWSDLRHYLGRLRSYRQAAETIVKGQKLWPKLFQNFKVYAIVSSDKMCKPLQKSNPQMTASEIINNMGLDQEQAQHYQQRAQNLQYMGLDKEIQRLIAQDTFRPIVHAEMLLYGRIQQANADPEKLYWNNWKYIGSSKPTCQLCSYYFEAKDVQVRATHHAIYQSWRLPDLRGQANIDEHVAELTHMVEKVKDEVRRMLDEKRSLGKSARNSSTGSVITGLVTLTSALNIKAGLPNHPGAFATAHNALHEDHNDHGSMVGQYEGSRDGTDEEDDDNYGGVGTDIE